MTESEKSRWFRQVSKHITSSCLQSAANLQWLQEQMHPYLSISMHDEVEAISALAVRLQSLKQNKRLVLSDTDKTLVVARLNRPGSLYNTLQYLRERTISYAQFSTSYDVIPGVGEELELQRFEFDRKSRAEIRAGGEVKIPRRLEADIKAALRRYYPAFDFAKLEKQLRVLWLNNQSYVRNSPPRRVAQLLWLYQQAVRQGGTYFTAEAAEEIVDQPEYRILFAAGNPPQLDFLHQTLEVFKRLDLGIKRAYCLTIHNGVHPYFLGSFYLYGKYEALQDPHSALSHQLQQELYNTQILSTTSPNYREMVSSRVMTGTDAALVDALTAFCHTSLAHNQPDRFSLEEVRRAFAGDLQLALQLIGLFCCRFDPTRQERTAQFATRKQSLEETLAGYNTGHQYLDEIRRRVFTCALLFIRHCLKTNFFVAEKQALAFRLDPAYLEELGAEFTADLPLERPFRITFFFARHGCGYHIGFSDIARGGWRTVLAKGWDDYVTNANSLFRENYVLAHTQHLKNKDIYEGGSKLVVLLDAADIDDRELVTQRLYKTQFGIINAFFDIFVTDQGQARDPRVVDYYGEDEPIELGPDENMHDEMVELIARLSRKRGYLLGSGVISSKRVGINHKEYGVTSTGVVKFAEVALAQLGIDMHRQPFSLKLTGGPGGDVAGNALRLLLERCPQMEIRLILDGSGALYDPKGVDHAALRKIVLQQDVEAFDPAALNPGGFLLLRNRRRQEGLRELFLRLRMTDQELIEEWLTLDEFHRQFGALIFTTPADLFIPAGGRPETVTAANCQGFIGIDGQSNTRVIVEGANSFLTPAAREALQDAGVVVLRDASANKCGVISSSYEIIGNLLLSDQEFLTHKERYVGDVLEILEKRADDEARLIFRRHLQAGGRRRYTEISSDISQEINGHYARLFAYFLQHPELCARPLFRRTLLAHLPKMLREHELFRRRVKILPAKYQAAILASEVASSLIYQQDGEADFEQMLTGHLQRNFAA
jgi:glutamate dehydrogenase